MCKKNKQMLTFFKKTPLFRIFFEGKNVSIAKKDRLVASLGMIYVWKNVSIIHLNKLSFEL